MAEKVTFNAGSKVISVELGVRELDVQSDVYSAWKRWVLASPENSKFLHAMRTVGGDTLQAGKTLGATFFLMNGWKIRPPEEDCTLNVIGNLYDDAGVAVFVKTEGQFNAMVIQTVSNLTDSQVVESELAKSLDYGGVVYYSETSYNTGNEYPVGTVNRPVNNLNDAIAICERVGTKTIRIYGNLTIDRNIEAYCFRGMDSTSNIFFDNNDVSSCTFDEVQLHGTLSGSIRANMCVLDNIVGLSGEFYTCGLKGVIQLANVNSCFVQCFTKQGISECALIDGSNVMTSTVGFRAYSGCVNIMNFNDPDTMVEFDFISGRLFVDNTNHDITIACRGVVSLINLSNITIDTSGMVNPSLITDSVLSAPIANYNDSNTFGGYIKNKVLSVAKFIGLS